MTGLEVLDEALTNLSYSNPDHYTAEVEFVHGLIGCIRIGLQEILDLSRNIPSLERSGSDAAKQSDEDSKGV